MKTLHQKSPFVLSTSISVSLVPLLPVLLLYPMFRTCFSHCCNYTKATPSISALIISTAAMLNRWQSFGRPELPETWRASLTELHLYLYFSCLCTVCFISLVSLHLWALVSLCWCVCNHCQRSRISEILKLHGSMSMQTFVWPCALSGVQVLITHSINFYPKKHFLCLSPTILIFLLFTTVQITFFLCCCCDK